MGWSVSLTWHRCIQYNNLYHKGNNQSQWPSGRGYRWHCQFEHQSLSDPESESCKSSLNKWEGIDKCVVEFTDETLSAFVGTSRFANLFGRSSPSSESESDPLLPELDSLSLSLEESESTPTDAFFCYKIIIKIATYHKYQSFPTSIGTGTGMGRGPSKSSKSGMLPGWNMGAV